MNGFNEKKNAAGNSQDVIEFCLRASINESKCYTQIERNQRVREYKLKSIE